jgi:hypothetical protein
MVDHPGVTHVPLFLHSMVKDLEVVFQNYSQLLSQFSHKHRHGHGSRQEQNSRGAADQLPEYVTSKPTEHFTARVEEDLGNSRPTLFFSGGGGAGGGRSDIASSVGGVGGGGGDGVGLGGRLEAEGVLNLGGRGGEITAGGGVGGGAITGGASIEAGEIFLTHPSYTKLLLNGTTNTSLDDLLPFLNAASTDHPAFYGNESWGPRYSVPKISAEIQIVLYVLIFLLAVVGNALVIVTLFQNKRMRTVTNVFLLNLALSDMLLAVFCMPFTLVPVLLSNFIFGAVMCVLIRYLQGKKT